MNWNECDYRIISQHWINFRHSFWLVSIKIFFEVWSYLDVHAELRFTKIREINKDIWRNLILRLASKETSRWKNDTLNADDNCGLIDVDNKFYIIDADDKNEMLDEDVKDDIFDANNRGTTVFAEDKDDVVRTDENNSMCDTDEKCSTINAYDKMICLR